MNGTRAVGTRPITRQWSPNLMFQLVLTAEQKRGVARFHKLKNYCERVGKPVRFWWDLLATEEISQLRDHICNQDREIDSLVRILAPGEDGGKQV